MVRNNRDYVRTQILYSLLQEDESEVLHVIANFLLLDGRSDEETFRRMIEEGCFGRLLELLRDVKEHDRRLYRLVLELAYEMSRIERLRYEDLLQIDDALVLNLFQMIESISDDMDDMYHYPVIRIIVCQLRPRNQACLQATDSSLQLVLNEQYMIASTLTAGAPSNTPAPLTNRVLKTLSVHGAKYRTFGENLILLLNRETETSLQLLILKLLYLLFTTETTFEYFYTNDLRVLLDVIIRNLLDLPNELMSLRHTYLRVLYPLLAHTQLRHPPHYKREEILRLLRILGGSGSAHFAPADETTVRLVARVSKVTWLGEESLGSAEVAHRYLGISMSQSQTASCVSVGDIAAVKERPGVKTPSRKTDLGARAEIEGRESGSHGGRSAPHESGVERREGPARPRKALPDVPHHQHRPPAVRAAGGTGSDSAKTPTYGYQKIPPELPPPRRRARMQTSSVAAAESLGAAEDVAASRGSMSVS